MNLPPFKITGTPARPCCPSPRLDAKGWMEDDGKLFLDLNCLECGTVLALFSWDRSDNETNPE